MIPEERPAADPSGEDYRRRLRELLRQSPGLLMNLLEMTAGSGDREPLRGVVEGRFSFSPGRRRPSREAGTSGRG
jgi:hypothetical protein